MENKETEIVKIYYYKKYVGTFLFIYLELGLCL